MNKDDIVQETKYLELINGIDDIIFDLLYGEEGGYTKLSSKDIVLNSKKIIEKFNYEVQKTVSNSEFSDIDAIINEKREELIEFVYDFSNKNKQIWSQEVFDKFIDNSLLLAKINKNNHNKIEKILDKAYFLINWISDIQGFSLEKNKYLKDDLTKKIKNIISSKDADFLPEVNPDNTDYSVFLKLRDDLIKEEADKINIEEFKNKLSRDDFNYFNKILNELKGFKKTQVLDDILLINTALSIIKTRTDKEKYDFIKEVDGDITIFLMKNKKIDEDEKLAVIKRRMKLFEDFSHRNTTSDYFKKLLTSN